MIGFGILGALGFTEAGVTAGSIAAGVQSVVYGGSTTGIFSLLQSAGTGVLGSVAAAVGWLAIFAGAAAIACAFLAFFN